MIREPLSASGAATLCPLKVTGQMGKTLWALQKAKIATTNPNRKLKAMLCGEKQGFASKPRHRRQRRRASESENKSLVRIAPAKPFPKFRTAGTRRSKCVTRSPIAFGCSLGADSEAAGQSSRKVAICATTSASTRAKDPSLASSVVKASHSRVTWAATSK